MPIFVIIIFGKCISYISKLFNLGNGSTWPGHIALLSKENFIQEILSLSKTKVILIAGTNGKTTTSKMLITILQHNGKKVIQNTSGANLLNGIASTLISHARINGKLTADYALFEIDENNLPLALSQITPHAIIVLNLFRDQLDRYGELDSIASKWKIAFEKLNTKTTIILNADDPLVSYLGTKLRALIAYFGLTENNQSKNTLQHAADSIYCPQCHQKLKYQKVYYSHLGIWRCNNCGLERPKPMLSQTIYPLPGTYNKYNALAASTYAHIIHIPVNDIANALKIVTPAFGRQEQLIVQNKKIQIFLSKNPTSFNQSLQTVYELGAKSIFVVLNDRIPDGRDVSWIWDVDFEEYVNKFETIHIAGDRVYDLALRLEYTMEAQSKKVNVYNDIKSAIKQALESLPKDETLYILPTYSAMLEVRKVLTGKKIL